MPISRQPAKAIDSRQLRSPKRAPSKRYGKTSKRAQFQSLGWEMAGRLTVNLALSLVALVTLMRMIPYYQRQRQVLQEVETAVETANQETMRLRTDFSRYFDPAQTSQIIEKNNVHQSGQHLPVVLVDSLAPQSDSEPGE